MPKRSISKIRNHAVAGCRSLAPLQVAASRTSGEDIKNLLMILRTRHGRCGRWTGAAGDYRQDTLAHYCDRCQHGHGHGGHRKRSVGRNQRIHDNNEENRIKTHFCLGSSAVQCQLASVLHLCGEISNRPDDLSNSSGDLSLTFPKPFRTNTSPIERLVSTPSTPKRFAQCEPGHRPSTKTVMVMLSLSYQFKNSTI
jgi:hypothetical protein